MTKAPNFRPMGARYLILPDEVKGELTQVGEYSIERDRDTHKHATEGTVVAVGNTASMKEPVLRCGDRIAFGQYSGYIQKFPETGPVEFLILQESEILGERFKTPFDESQDSLPLVMETIE